MLGVEGRDTLDRWPRREKSPRALAPRSRLMLGYVKELGNNVAAARLG